MHGCKDFVRTNPAPSDLLGLDRYDRIIVAFSGGKDSLACVLHLLDQGVDPAKLELWHHGIDGTPDGGARFMDWPITEGYVEAASEALDLELRYSWKVGGFEREMLRNNTPTAPISFQDENFKVLTTGGQGPLGTRLKFPQVTADLSRRWCSAYLKVDVGRRVFSRDPRFAKGAFLLITGERRQESAARSRYLEVERHPTTTRMRRVDQWRAVIDWSEEEVWEIIEKYRIQPHPAYRLGWGRVSCMTCIFGSPDQWAAIRQIAADKFSKIADYEDQFGLTIHRTRSVREQAAHGRSFVPPGLQSLIDLAMSEEYDEPIIIPDGKKWVLPIGAMGDNTGPT
jgi:3'-phosphoadenosine 5'-phosphosulfate sulfotransferase (PAPS reductase)/FAD synthetase